MACFTVSVFTRVRLARGRRRGGPEDAPPRLQSCTTLFLSPIRLDYVTNSLKS